MKAPALAGVALMAALAAIFLSQRAAAQMLDAKRAGDIYNPNNAQDAQNIQPGTAMQLDTTPPTTLSNAGLDALKTREGFSPTPYPDHKGYSIGYGHLILPTESFTTIDQAQALDLLSGDVAWAEESVSNNVTVAITQNAFDALVSFCFNVGKNAFENSTLLKKINAEDATAVDEFDKWVYSRYANGIKQIDASLQSRRDSEAEQFVS